MILLVRHASAGRREEWIGDDRLRPLDARGRRQALGLVDLLAPYAIDRVVSSPYVRCVQTVEPLAAARALEIEPREELSEERQGSDAPSLLAALAGDAVAMCTHGGLERLLHGVDEYRKGQVIVLGDDLAPLRHLGP